MKPHGILGVVASCALGLHHLKGMTEIWKDIKGYENYYKVSDFGRVKSLGRVIINVSGSERFIPGRIMSTQMSSDGYPTVKLSINGKSKRITIHRLVAKAFIPNTEHKETVNHIDAIKTHNFPHNLEWNTRGENMHHASVNGLIRSKPPKGVVQLTESGKFIEEFDILRDASRKTGIGSGNIANVCTGRRNRAGGFKWMYKTDYNGK